MSFHHSSQISKEGRCLDLHQTQLHMQRFLKKTTAKHLQQLTLTQGKKKPPTATALLHLSSWVPQQCKRECQSCTYKFTPSNTAFWTTDCSAGLDWSVVPFQHSGFKGTFGFLLQCRNRCHFCSKSMTKSVQTRIFSGTASQKYWIRGCFSPPIKKELL